MSIWRRMVRVTGSSFSTQTSSSGGHDQGKLIVINEAGGQPQEIVLDRPAREQRYFAIPDVVTPNPIVRLVEDVAKALKAR